MDKIICVGKNYLAHAQEFGEIVPEKPVLFLKPPSVLKQSLSWQEQVIADFPADNGEEVHPECEIALLLQQGGYQLSREQALQSIAAVTLGLDMTLRVRQAQLKKAGHPWTTAKVFPDSAILAPWIPLIELPDYLNTPFSLSINDQLKQQSTGSDMLMQPLDLIVYISHFFPLCAGDIIFTGTPAGVSKINAHDTLQLNWGARALTVQFSG